MSTPRTLKTKLLLGAAVVTAGAAFVVPSTASAATASAGTAPTDPAGELPLRWQRACLRIPNIEIRTTNFITRLEGDASVKGSLAWLQAQIEDAKAKNRPQLVTVLENRLKVRTQTLEILKNRLEKLERLAEKCRNHGVDI
jgi:hypothetical protein